MPAFAKRKRSLLIAFATAGGLALLWWWINAEPTVNGRPVSYWIEPQRYDQGETFASVSAAFAAMDRRSVRWFVRELDWQPPRFRQTLATNANRLLGAIDLFSVQPHDDRRLNAAVALGNLGVRSAVAVPALERAAETTVEPDAWMVRAAAKAALIRLGHEDMQAHIDALADASDRARWYEEIAVLEGIGTNAAPAVPVAAAFVLSTGDGRLRGRAAGFLGAMRHHPEICVPALLHALDDPTSRAMALTALGRFGRAASNATDAVFACVTDTNRIVQAEAAWALRSIDPARADALANLQRR